MSRYGRELMRSSGNDNKAAVKAREIPRARDKQRESPDMRKRQQTGVNKVTRAIETYLNNNSETEIQV
jgi:hypothetical protein